jgi:hypothetical protein
MIEVGKCRGVDADGVAKTEADAFGNCPACGACLDMRDLWQVLAHVHAAEMRGSGIAVARSRLHG